MRMASRFGVNSVLSSTSRASFRKFRLHVPTHRTLVHEAANAQPTPISARPSFAFAFDIDGVLCRSSTALDGATRALKTLQDNDIPFVLLTNGGGTRELARVQKLIQILGVRLHVRQLIQSHTPFSNFKDLKQKTVLVMGSGKTSHSVRKLALHYGFKNVVTPLDIYGTHPEILPSMKAGTVQSIYPIINHTKPLPKPLVKDTGDFSENDHLKIDAAIVFNDPTNWALDITVLLDALLSHQGYIGTISPKNGDESLPNRGYLQDGQPPVYFSNPDVWWAAQWHQPRLGQGAFRAALEGTFKAATQGAELLNVEQWGKPSQQTYEYAEKVLMSQQTDNPPTTVYMVGDNPESDIRGANNFKSPSGAEWKSLLVRSGVYSGGTPTAEPKAIVDGVWEAVQHAMKEMDFTPR